jgi:hypothetical protein
LLPEALGRDGEEELVFCAIASSEAQAVELEDALRWANGISIFLRTRCEET